MSARLFGPLDAAQPRVAVRDALERLSGLPALATDIAAMAPGLYALTTGDPPALVGFWWTFGPDYLDDGPGESPDRAPPLTAALLEGLTDAVWWRHEPSGSPHRRSLIIALEWPPELGARATEDAHRVFPLTAPADDASSSSDRSPPRSLVTLIVARLEVSGGRHHARWRLLYPSELGADAEAGAGWLETARAAPVDSPPPANEASASGAPLPLPGPPRLGVALDHWLTRDLRPWPRAPARPELGATAVRDVGDPSTAQLRRGAGQTVAILGVTALFGAVGHRLAQRDPVAHAAPKQDQPFPSLADCSLDDPRFQRELKAQLTGPDPRLALCGLLQREARRSVPGEPEVLENAGRYALASACFKAIGEPTIYHSSQNKAAVAPRLILDDPTRRKAELTDTLDALQADCDAMEQQIEALVQGAILAAHVAPDPDARAEPVQRSQAGLMGSLLLPQDAARPGAPEIELADHVRQGVTQGLDAPLALPKGSEAADFWARLAVSSEELQAHKPTVSDYLAARFDDPDDPDDPRERDAVSEPLWRCHVQLTGGATGHPAPPSEVKVRWGLPAPMPTAYGHGTVSSQLQLDAILTSLRVDAQDLGPCWRVIDQTLTRYQPVHPLLGKVEPDGWPSEAQRVCGQVCAVAYSVRGASIRFSGRWWTRDQDLSQCVGGGVPMADALRVPWPEDAVQDSTEICAFNLIAQGFVGGEGAPLLGPGSSPIAWAGQDRARPERAGDPSGQAALAVTELHKAVQSGEGLGTGTVDPGVWSEDNCRRVAAQCYVGLLLDATHGDELSTWKGSWGALLPWISGNHSWKRPDARVAVQRKAHPWCEPIWSALDTGQVERKQVLDVLCRNAIHETGQAVQSWMDELLETYNAGGEP